MSLRCVYGLRAYYFFQICHCAELNKIVEATTPVNPYDDRKVSLRRPHENGDLDIVGASYTQRKANVAEALNHAKQVDNMQYLDNHPRHASICYIKRTA